MQNIKILVVDSHAMVCSGISELLGGYPDFEVVGHTGCCLEALRILEQVKPDIVVVDPDLPGEISGIELVHRLLHEYPQVLVMILTNLLDEGTVREVLRSGAVGYLLKTSSIENLAHAIRAAFQGQCTLSPQVTQLLVQTPDAAGQLWEKLTRREYQILEQITQGKNNADIAKELQISLSTVQFHVGNILTKLNVNNRVEAATFAIRRKLLL